MNYIRFLEMIFSFYFTIIKYAINTFARKKFDDGVGRIGGGVSHEGTQFFDID